MNYTKTLVALAIVAASIGSTLAQQSTGQPATPAGNVSVDISDVKADIAKNLNVDAATLPTTVQVPVGVAANVCGVGADQLAPGKQTAGQLATCKATLTNNALEQAIKSGTK